MRKYSVTVETNDLPFDLPPQRGDEFMVHRLAPPWEGRAKFPRGTIREIWHHHEHGIHCEHRPALTITDPKGQVLLEQWYRDGELHRDDAPAERCFSSDGKLERESWYRKGKLHRQSGPAQTIFDQESGKSRREEWRVLGVLHRNHGAAVTESDDTGVQTRHYYRQGLAVSAPSSRSSGRGR